MGNTYDNPERYLVELARANRKNPTSAEAVLWEALRNRKLDGVKFVRQKPVKGYIGDFYCRALSLIVELDGGIHDTPANQEHDRIRTEWLEAHLYRVIRFRNEEVLESLESVLQRIRQELKLPPPYPKQPKPQ
jgi:5-methyltetrahydrofolate--homocysteine methyltransferase